MPLSHGDAANPPSLTFDRTHPPEQAAVVCLCARAILGALVCLLNTDLSQVDAGRRADLDAGLVVAISDQLVGHFPVRLLLP
jgi:hypothetical protein